VLAIFTVNSELFSQTRSHLTFNLIILITLTNQIFGIANQSEFCDYQPIKMRDYQILYWEVPEVHINFCWADVSKRSQQEEIFPRFIFF